MNDKTHRVMFRMTLKDYQRWYPLIKHKHHYTWSALVRHALEEYLKANPVPPSDNGVRHAAGETETPSLFTRAKKQTTRRHPSRRGKSKV